MLDFSNSLIQPRCMYELFLKLTLQSGHFLVERLAVVFLILFAPT